MGSNWEILGKNYTIKNTPNNSTKWLLKSVQVTEDLLEYS